MFDMSTTQTGTEKETKAIDTSSILQVQLVVR